MKRLLLFVMMCASMSFAFGQKKGDKVSKVITSEIQWWGHKIVKTVPTAHTGTLQLKSGKFNFDKTVLVDGEFIIDMRSLTVSDLGGDDQTKLTNELKGTNFFEVKKFPIAKFHLKRIIPLANNEFNSTVIGDLTIKGIRKTISFPANVHITQFTVDIQSSKFSINRKDYKIVYQNSIKDYFIKDEMEIQFKLSTQKIDNTRPL